MLLKYSGLDIVESRNHLKLMKPFKPLTWKLAIIAFGINLVLVSLLVWIGNQTLSSKIELDCRKQMDSLQTAVDHWNKDNPQDQKLFMEFGFPGFVETVLGPKKYLTAPITDLREHHSYYLQRNGFVNCRLHPRNPWQIYDMGILILTLITTLLSLALLGYRIQWNDTPGTPTDHSIVN